MSGKANKSSRSAAGGRGADSEPKTKKQRLAATSEKSVETDEELYQNAVSLVFGGELYAKLLRYAGPEGIAHLRGDRKWRKAMDELPADDLRELDLPVVARPDDLDLVLLRELLTEPIPTALVGRASGCWTLSELGWKILAASPLTPNAVISDVINSGNDKLLDPSISLRSGNSAKILTELICLEKPEIFWRIACHPNATSEVLSAILVRLPGSKLSDYSVRLALLNVAGHKNTGKLDLNFLSEDEDTTIRGRVASNQCAPAYLLRKLSSDTSTEVRAAVARNRKTPRDKLVSLSIDPSDFVRAAVARNVGAGLDLLLKLALDESQCVLEALVYIHKKYFDLIFDEARKSHRSIIAEYSVSPSALERLVGMDDGRYDEIVACNSNTSQEVLARLATSDNDRVRRGVAGNKNTSAAKIEQLWNDDANKWSIADNESTPIHILEKLAKDEDLHVLENVAGNRSATPEILRGIISSNPPDSIPYTVFENERLPIGDVVAFATKKIEEDTELPEEFKECLFDRLEDEKDGLPVSLVVAMSKKDTSLQRRAVTYSNLPVKDILRLSKIEDIRESLEENPLLQVAVDKLHHLLSSGGVGSGAQFIEGESWW